MGRPHEDPDGAKQMAEDILGFGAVLGFLMKLLDPGHPAGLLGLLHPVADEDYRSVMGKQRGYAPNYLKPRETKGFQ